MVIISTAAVLVLQVPFFVRFVQALFFILCKECLPVLLRKVNQVLSLTVSRCGYFCFRICLIVKTVCGGRKHANLEFL